MPAPGRGAAVAAGAQVAAQVAGLVVGRSQVWRILVAEGAGWRHRQAAGWRRFRTATLAGQPGADDAKIDHATAVATWPLPQRAQPWIWGRPPRPKRWNRRWLVSRV